MAYVLFGGGPADVTTDNRGVVVGGVEFTVWTHATGGQRVTDLLDTDGQTLPGRVESAHTATDPTDVGRIRFQAPDTFHVLYLDRGYGDRWQVVPASLGQIVATAVTRSQTALADSAKAVTDAAAALAVARAQVDVRQFGAIGDGRVDDTAAFIAALAELDTRGGGTLYVPPLTFRIAGHIPLVDNVSIDGWGASFVKHGGSRSSYAYFSAQSLGARGYGSGCRNVRVAGIRFTGDFATDTTTCAFGLHHAQDVVIEQCHFDQMQGGGHCIDLAGCENITIRDCRFTGFKEAAPGSVYRRVEAIQIDISTKGATSVVDQDGSFDGLHTRNVTVESCTFETLTLGQTEYPAPNPIGSHARRESAVAENIVFRNNRVGRLTEDRTSALRGGIHFTAISGLTIAGNTFDCPANTRIIGLYVQDTGTPAASDPNGTPPAQKITPLPVDNVTITGNTFVQEITDTVSLERPIYIGGVQAARAKNITLSGNRFRCQTTYGWLVTLDHVETVRIADNTGTGVHIAVIASHGADITSSRNRWDCADKTPQSYNGQSTEQYRSIDGLLVEGLHVRDPLDPAVWAGESCTDVAFRDCTILNPKQTTANRGDALRIAGAARFTITGNKLTTDNQTAKAYGIEVYGSGTARGLVSGNIITGYTTPVNVNGITTVTATGNI